MCIAIVQLEGRVLSKERLKICYEANDDGCGMAWVHNEKVAIFKTLDFDTFYKEYKRQTRKHPESKFLIHFRIKTQGKINVDNCHPFRIDEQTAFIHNGTIPKMPKCDSRSDTSYFNEQILSNLPEGWIYNSAIHALLEQFIGWSKIAVLNHLNEVLILNESSGHWDDDGNWYSNKSYEEKPVTSYKGYVSYTPKSSGRSDWRSHRHDYYDINDRGEYWVGSQKRRFREGQQLQAYDYDLQMWRDIDYIGCYVNSTEEDKNQDFPLALVPSGKITVYCELCESDEDREDAVLASYEHEADTFYICQSCKQKFQDYITLGTIEVLYDPKGDE
jgi:predicted glutamine amidotransferase